MYNEAFKPQQAESGVISVQDVSVATTTANVALTANGPMLRIANRGAGGAYYLFSNDPAAVATVTTGIYMPAGAVEVITKPERCTRIITIGDAITNLNIVGGTGV